MSPEYFLIKACDDYAASLPKAELADAIANMNSSEFIALNMALRKQEDSLVGYMIQKSIRRQYKHEIERIALEEYNDYLEALKEDELERQHEAKKER